MFANRAPSPSPSLSLPLSAHAHLQIATSQSTSDEVSFVRCPAHRGGMVRHKQIRAMELPRVNVELARNACALQFQRILDILIEEQIQSADIDVSTYVHPSNEI